MIAPPTDQQKRNFEAALRSWIPIKWKILPSHVITRLVGEGRYNGIKVRVSYQTSNTSNTSRHWGIAMFYKGHCLVNCLGNSFNKTREGLTRQKLAQDQALDVLNQSGLF